MHAIVVFIFLSRWMGSKERQGLLLDAFKIKTQAKNSLVSSFFQLVCSLPASTRIPEFTLIPENSATTIFSGIRVGICTSIISYLIQ